MHTQTRLTRSATDKVMGGVCGGIAEYFGIDPVIVRLIFVALVFAGGTSVVLYPLLWLIIPGSTAGQPALAEGWNDMQQVARQMRGQMGQGTQAFRSTIGNAFTGRGGQPRFDPQTGQPLPRVAHTRNRTLGMALLAVGVIMLASYIPGGSSVAIALMLLAGGLYLMRQHA